MNTTEESKKVPLKPPTLGQRVEVSLTGVVEGLELSQGEVTVLVRADVDRSLVYVPLEAIIKGEEE